MSDWLLDLGNSRLKLAVLERGELRGLPALAHAEPGFDTALAQALEALPRARRAWLASVAAADLSERVRAIVHRLGVPCETAFTRAELAGVRIAYAEPQALGVDRFLALLAAHRRGPGPWLIVGVGTAITIDLLDAGAHRGGLIAPSPALMRRALARQAHQLDVADGLPVDWAGNTADALAGGVHAAALGMIERCHARAAAQLDAAPRLLLAGGGAPDLLPALALPAQFLPELVLEGLAVYAAAIG